MKSDKERILQCCLCGRNPETCGCDDSDEDKDGMCTKFEGKYPKLEVDYKCCENCANAIYDSVPYGSTNADYLSGCKCADEMPEEIWERDAGGEDCPFWEAETAESEE